MTVEMQKAMEELKKDLIEDFKDSSEGASYYECETENDYEKYFEESLQSYFDDNSIYTADAYSWFESHSIALTQLGLQYICQYHEDLSFNELDMEKFIQWCFNAVEEYCIGRSEMFEWFKKN